MTLLIRFLQQLILRTEFKVIQAYVSFSSLNQLDPSRELIFVNHSELKSIIDTKES